MRVALTFSGLIGLMLGIHSAGGAMRTVPSSADTTIYEVAGSNAASGGGSSMYVGRNSSAPNVRTRALIRYNLQGYVPPGSIIQSAELGLRVTSSRAVFVTVHKVLSSWGEGTSLGNSGLGSAADIGEATWVHQNYATNPWDTPGGDHDPAFDLITAVGTQGLNTPGPTDMLNAHVQSWVDAPASNFGWLLRLLDEGVLNSQVSIAARENVNESFRPVLIVAFRVGGDANSDDRVDVDDFGVLAANFNRALSGPDAGDFNRNGVVNIDDFGILAGNFNLVFAPAAGVNPRGGVAVPEPVGVAGFVAGFLAAFGRRRA